MQWDISCATTSHRSSKIRKREILFKKGHIVREEDIPALLSVGKEHLFVWEKKEGILHENEAAEILYKISSGEHMHGSDIKEGKIEADRGLRRCAPRSEEMHFLM